MLSLIAPSFLVRGYSCNHNITIFLKKHKRRPYFYLQIICELNLCKNNISEFIHFPKLRPLYYPKALSSWVAVFYARTHRIDCVSAELNILQELSLIDHYKSVLDSLLLSLRVQLCFC